MASGGPPDWGVERLEEEDFPMDEGGGPPPPSGPSESLPPAVAATAPVTSPGAPPVSAEWIGGVSQVPPPKSGGSSAIRPTTTEPGDIPPVPRRALLLAPRESGVPSSVGWGSGPPQPGGATTMPVWLAPATWGELPPGWLRSTMGLVPLDWAGLVWVKWLDKHPTLLALPPGVECDLSGLLAPHDGAEVARVAALLGTATGTGRVDSPHPVFSHTGCCLSPPHSAGLGTHPGHVVRVPFPIEGVSPPPPSWPTPREWVHSNVGVRRPKRVEAGGSLRQFWYLHHREGT